MCIRQSILRIVVAVFTLVVAAVSRAQNPGYLTPTGMPDYGSFISSNIDSVDLAHGGLKIQIPFLTRQARGFTFSAGFRYESKFWVAFPYTLDMPDGETFERFAWQPSGTMWDEMDSPGGYYDFNEQTYTCTPWPSPDQPPGSVFITSDWRYVTGDGTVYSFPVRSVNVIRAAFGGNTCNDDIVHTPQLLSGPSNTGGLTIDISSYPVSYNVRDVRLSFKNGTVQSNLQTDSNGNQWNGFAGGMLFGDNAWSYDTLGRPFKYSHTTADPNVRAMDYYDSDGQLRTVKIQLTSLQLNTAFPDGSPSPTDCGFDQYVYGVTVPQAIILPNGLSYTFSYDDPDNPGHTNPFGEVTKITLPTGGYIKYKWSTIPNADPGPPSSVCSPGGNMAADSRVVIERRASADGVNESVWQYSYNGTTTVTDPEGNVQIHTFSGQPYMLETQVEYRQGSTTVLRRVVTDWATDTGPVESAQTVPMTDPTGLFPGMNDLRNPRPIRETTTLVGSNLVKKTETDYSDCNSYSTYYGQSLTDCRDNPTQAREFDYGTGAAGPKIRYATLSYLHQTNSSYFNAHILDRVADKQIFDASDNLKARTKFSYDTTTITGTSGVPNHNYGNYSSANAIRGNPTLIQRWLSSNNSWLNTTNYFNDVGRIVQTKDPGSFITSFSYADNFTDGVNRNSQGFLTSVTHPATGNVSHVEGSQYYWYTGLLAASCGQNTPNPGTCTNTLSPTPSSPVADYAKYTYDLLGRPATVVRGDGGQTTVAFSESALPFSVSATTTIDSAKNLVNSTVVDGLGRVSQRQLNSDPAGVDFVDSAYDALGRVSSVSNPHRSTASPTDGSTSTIYDALGRATQVTKQDGSTVTSQYDQTSTNSPNATCTITTDEAGKQGESCVDGLGRLIEADEPGGSGAGSAASGGLTINGTLQSTTVGGTPATHSTGSVTVNPSGGTDRSTQALTHPATSGGGTITLSGNEQSKPSSGGAPGQVSITIVGSEQSVYVPGDRYCAVYDDSGDCVDWEYNPGTTIYDTGTVGIAVNGHPATVYYGGADTTNTIASGLASTINGDSAASVNASLSGSVLTLTSKVTGAAGNYAFSTGVIYDSADFGGPSFAATPTSGSLTGGTNPGPPVYDHGTCTVTINGTAYAASYNQGDTTNTIASALASAISAGTLVTGVASGGTISLTAKTTGAATNYPLSSSCSYDSSNFSTASFAAGASGTTLTGGSDNGYTTYYDAGTVTVTVNGHSNQVSFSQGSTSSTIATALAAAVNADSVAYVTATASGNSVNLTSKAAGAAVNYPLTSSYTYDTAHFSGAYFTSGNSGATLTGGADAIGGTTVYDAGTVSLTVGAFSVSTSYGQNGNNTAALVASALASGLNGSNSPVTATASGATIGITYKTSGVAGNVAVTSNSATSQGAYFSSASFTSPGTTLSGGADPVPPSLNTPYVTLYQYDVLGNLVRVDQKGSAPNDNSQWRTRTFGFDSVSRMVTTTNPESGTMTYSYDADGSILQKTSPAPNQAGSATQTISYCYDALNRVTGKAYSVQTCTNGQLPAGTAVVSYTYDQGSNGTGRLTHFADAAGSTDYTYDPAGHIASETRVINGASKTMSYEYNLDGSTHVLHYPSGASVTYAADAAGRMISAVDAGNSINYVTSAGYGPDGSLTGFISGFNATFAGIANLFTYNNRLQPCRMTASTGVLPGSCNDSSNHGNVLDLGYNFNAGASDNGNVLGTANYKDHSRDQVFTYDALNRVSSAQNVGTDCTQGTLNGHSKYWGNNYTYDAWGNLIAKTSTKCNAEGMDRTADGQNRLHVKTGADFQYDAAGNMTYDVDGLYYSYDAENRINGAGGFAYIYDGDGNRVEKSNGSTGTLYWYMMPGIIAESDLAGNLTSEYVFFGGTRVARRDLPSGAVSYYFSDHLKTTDVVTDAQGNIKNESDFYPWGGELQFIANDSNHYKFTGQERDTETGLDYFGARYYGSAFGRFTSVDPVVITPERMRDPQQFNAYAYVRDNPLRFADPKGMNLSAGDIQAIRQHICAVGGPTACKNANVDPKTGATSGAAGWSGAAPVTSLESGMGSLLGDDPEQILHVFLDPTANLDGNLHVMHNADGTTTSFQGTASKNTTQDADGNVTSSTITLTVTTQTLDAHGDIVKTTTGTMTINLDAKDKVTGSTLNVAGVREDDSQAQNMRTGSIKLLQMKVTEFVNVKQPGQKTLLDRFKVTLEDVINFFGSDRNLPDCSSIFCN